MLRQITFSLKITLFIASPVINIIDQTLVVMDINQIFTLLEK